MARFDWREVGRKVRDETTIEVDLVELLRGVYGRWEWRRRLASIWLRIGGKILGMGIKEKPRKAGEK